jgi:hypothetical protein
MQLEGLFRSVHPWCSINKQSVPSETKKIGKWLKGNGSSGFEVGLEIFGVGGNIGAASRTP